MIYVILTPNGVDYSTPDKRDANRHVFDLRAMDVGKVEVKKFPSWRAAYAKYPDA